jgi:thioesterase domain-containing protein
MCYLDLARRLGPSQPVLGLQARGLAPGEDVHTRIEEMAACYIAAVREVQPEPPYLLAGWSSGGVVAFEMARQLHDQGHPVALLAMFDSRVPTGHASGLDDAALIAALLDTLGRLAGADVSIRAADLRAMEQEARLLRLLDEARRCGAAPADLTLEQAARLFAVYRAGRHALLRYWPGLYAGRVTLFQAETPLPAHVDEDGGGDIAAGWRPLAGGGLDMHRVPGDHVTMVTPPNVEMLAAALRKCVEEVKDT